MANKNLFPKDATSAKTIKQAEKGKKADKPKSQDDSARKAEAPASEEQQVVKAKSSKGKKTVKVSAKLKAKKPSMVDAALQVLGQTKEPMNCKELVEAITTKGLWASPNGKTPANTLYSAFLRLIQNKGKGAPIRKADKGTFELNPSATA